MESLKKLEEICHPDERQKFFARLDLASTTGFRSLTLKDFHEAANSIQLHEGVPEDIRNHFQTARNLIIYSWFYYPFNVTAQLCAYTSLEFALRTRAGINGGRISLRALLERAVKENWIRDEDIVHVKRHHENLRAYNESLPPEWRSTQTELAQEFCKRIAVAIPGLRNSLAHGSTLLHNKGASAVRLCADLINQLFERPKANMGK